MYIHRLAGCRTNARCFWMLCSCSMCFWHRWAKATKALTFMQFQHGIYVTGKTETKIIGRCKEPGSQDTWITAAVSVYKQRYPGKEVYGFTKDVDLIGPLHDLSCLLTVQNLPIPDILGKELEICLKTSCCQLVRSVLMCQVAMNDTTKKQLH